MLRSGSSTRLGLRRHGLQDFTIIVGLVPVFVEICNLEDRQAQQALDEVNQVVLGRRTRHFESRVHGQGRRTGPDLGNLTGGNPWPARAFASDDLTRYAR